MNINHLKTGLRIKVHSWYYGEVVGTVAEAYGVNYKFLQLDNGEELFDFEFDKYEVER